MYEGILIDKLLLVYGSMYYLLLHYTSVIIANFPGEKNILKKKFHYVSGTTVD